MLAVYTYNAYNGKLATMRYGNGASVNMTTIPLTAWKKYGIKKVENERIGVIYVMKKLFSAIGKVFLAIESLFEPQLNLKSYKYPTIKLIISVIIIPVALFRDQIFGVTDKTVSTVLSFIFIPLCMGAIFCIGISGSELIIVSDNLDLEKKKYSKKLKHKPYSIDKIISMVTQNDIIEIEILLENKIVKIGASSDCNRRTGAFFDKVYYIADTEYRNIEDFCVELEGTSKEGVFPVVSIDGVCVK